MYAELTYFDGYHFQHIADWEEKRRQAWKKRQRNEAIDRAGGRR